MEKTKAPKDWSNEMDTVLKAFAMQYEEPIEKKDPENLAAPAQVVGMKRRFLFEGKEREILKNKFLELVKNLGG